MAPAADLSRPPPRIPKLTYRNRLPADDLLLISRTSSTSTDAPPNDSSVDQALTTPNCTPVSTLDFDCRSTTSSQSASLASSDGSVSRESKASSTKRKKNGVLNFLTLKEPSQSALDQFADAQRKQTAARGGLTSPVGMQGISPQKLPPSVPKVNSKWNGVPESLKSSRSSVTSSKRTSTTSSTSSKGSPSYTTRNTTINSSAVSVATNDSRGPPNSLASPMHSAIDVGEYTPTKFPPRADSPSSASLPEMTYFFPDDPSLSAASPASSADHPWSPPPRPDQDSSQVFVTDFDEKLSISEPDTVTSDKVNAIFRRLSGGAGEFPGVYYDSDDEDPDVPDTHDFLFDVKPIVTTPPPRTSSHQSPVQPISPTPVSPTPVPHHVPTGKPTANFSRPRPNQTYSKPSRPSAYSHHSRFGPPALPTLYEASIASTDDTDAASDTTEIGRTYTHSSTGSTESFSAPSIAPSMAPSVATSFTPSVMSASWYRSSRERLGLGGRIRKNELLPWEQTDHRGKPKKSRLSVFSRG
jgi:hypothetical protein